MLLNEIIYVTTAVFSTVTIMYKQNIFKQLKWKLRMQKEIEEYGREISNAMKWVRVSKWILGKQEKLKENMRSHQLIRFWW